MNDRYSKLAFLHRVKERKTPSLSAQASFSPFSLKVAWSGKSLIQVCCNMVYLQSVSLNIVKCRAVQLPVLPRPWRVYPRPAVWGLPTGPLLDEQ